MIQDGTDSHHSIFWDSPSGSHALPRRDLQDWAPLRPLMVRRIGIGMWWYIYVYMYIYIFVINLLWVNILMNIYTWYIGVDWWYLCFIYICIYIYRVVWCFLGVFECWRSMFICLEMDLLTKEHMRKSGRAPHNNLVQLQSYFLPRVFFYS